MKQRNVVYLRKTQVDKIEPSQWGGRELYDCIILHWFENTLNLKDVA